MWELAGGSVTGRDHLRIGKNNQDACYSVVSEDYAIAVVCDGCGSGDHSEVGAKVGVRLVVSAIATAFRGRELEASAFPSAEFWEKVRQDVLKQLQDLAVGMGDNFAQTILHYFLFTVVGTLVTPMGVTVFSIGDGVIIINGEVRELGPFPGNAPPYLAYSLLGESEPTADGKLHFQIRQFPIEKVKAILIGTDGVIDLINAGGCNLPGKQEMVGEISQFWEENRYFKNPDRVRRQLYLMNRAVPKIDWKNQKVCTTIGLLPDDTTLMVIRKKVATD